MKLFSFDYIFLNKCYSNVSTTETYPTGYQLDITINAESTESINYVFNDIPRIWVENSNSDKIFEKRFSLSTDKRTATLSFIPSDNVFVDTNEIYLQATASEPIPVEMTYFDLDFLDGATTNIDSQKGYEKGIPVDITLTAQDGFYFSEVPYIAYFDEYFIEKTEDFKLNETKTIATLNFSNDNVQASEINRVQIHGSTVIIPDKPLTFFNTCNVYAPTNEELRALLKIRFDENSNSKDNYDLARFIIGIKYTKLPIDRHAKSIIKLGDYKVLDTKADTLNNIKLETDLEDIIIPRIQNNVLDYTKTNYYLNLPFYGLYELSNEVVNKTIRIKYTTNLLDNTSQITITNATDNYVIDILNCLTCTDIPYKTITYEGGKFSSEFLNVNSPQLIIKYHKALSDRADVNKIANINELYGFNRFVDVNLTNGEDGTTMPNKYSMISDVKDLIIAELENGVYIRTTTMVN